jgi:ribosomal protein S18 acetylase RimI-like enzyme
VDILINILTPDQLKSQLPEFIAILKDEPGEYWREGHFLLDLPHKFELSVAATEGHVIAGYIIASLKEEGPYIHKFMVRKDRRSQSVGRKMLDFFEKNIKEKGFSSVTLTVRKDNERAISFYRRNLFEVTGSRSDPADNSELITMTKILPAPGKKFSIS